MSEHNLILYKTTKQKIKYVCLFVYWILTQHSYTKTHFNITHIKWSVLLGHTVLCKNVMQYFVIFYCWRFVQIVNQFDYNYVARQCVTAKNALL